MATISFSFIYYCMLGDNGGVQIEAGMPAWYSSNSSSDYYASLGLHAWSFTVLALRPMENELLLVIPLWLIVCCMWSIKVMVSKPEVRLMIFFMMSWCLPDKFHWCNSRYDPSLVNCFLQWECSSHSLTNSHITNFNTFVFNKCYSGNIFIYYYHSGLFHMTEFF